MTDLSGRHSVPKITTSVHQAGSVVSFTWRIIARLAARGAASATILPGIGGGTAGGM